MKRLIQEKFLLYKVRTKRDPDAFGRIYDVYATRIYRFVYFKVSSEEEAQDITADVFLKTWQYLIDEKGREIRHLSALLYGIARNAVIDHYRARAARGETVAFDDAIGSPSTSLGAEHDGEVARKQLEAELDVRALSAHLRSLKDEYREVLIMKYLDEMETDEISAAIGKTPGNVRVTLHRALNALRNVLEDQNEGQASHRTTEAAPD